MRLPRLVRALLGMRLPRPVRALLGVLSVLAILVLFSTDAAADGRTGLQVVGSTDNAYFGFGTDGAVTFDGTTTVLGLAPSASAYTLTRDIYLTTGTINTGVTINTGGFRIFASAASGIANAGTIQNNGQVGTAAPSSGFVGVSGGNGGAAGSVGVSNAGGGGGGSASGGGTGNGANDPQGFTGTGGAGGGGATNAPGAGGPITVVSGEGYGVAELITARDLSGNRFSGGTGGGGGGSNPGAGGGAGGGGGGGVVWIAAPSITGIGTIQANGGNGGAGNAYGLASGGGGGGGGLVLIFTSTLTTFPGTIRINGGTGGAQNSGGGAGVSGASGKFIIVDPGSLSATGSPGNGTVTSVQCGTGLIGGTITASGTCAIDTTVVQQTSSALVTGCSTGSALSAISQAGTPTCVATGGSLSGTAGALARWVTSSNLGASAATDDGTTLTTGSFAYGQVSQTLGASGTINNYAIGSAGAYYEITTVGTTIITGITNGVPGRRITVYNVSGGPITWNNLSGSSTAPNRLTMVAGVSTWVTASDEYIDFVYSGTDSTWHQVQTEHFAAIVDAGALNVGGTLTLSSVVNGTGRFSITNGAAQSSVFATTTGAQTTNNLQALGGNMAGSFNTTAGALTEVSVTGTTTSTRSSGTNALTGIGGQFSASGAQVNYAIQTTAGSVDLATGHLNDTGGTAPALTSCGTSPTITGTDISGTVVEGSTATGCTITFAVSYNGNGTTTDSCVVTPHGVQATFGYTESAATLVVTNTTAETFSYVCVGH